MFKFSAQKLFSNSSFRTFRRNQRSFISEETNENNTDSSQDSANTSSLPSSLMDDKKQERRLPKFKPTLRVPWIRKGVSETKTEVTTLTEQSDKNINNIVEDNQENGVTSNHTTPFQKLKSKLRRKNSGNWTSHRNGRIGNVKSALRIFAAVGDGLAPLPGIKGAAGIALEIANVMEIVQNNENDAQFVTKAAQDLIQIICDSPTQNATPDSAVSVYTRDFETGLKEIIDTIESSIPGNIPWYKKILRGEGDKARIADCNRLLTQHVERFKIKMSLNHTEALRHQCMLLSDEITTLKKIYLDKGLHDGYPGRLDIFNSNYLFFFDHRSVSISDGSPDLSMGGDR